MKIVFPMIIMLIAGLALGAGGSTLLWSGMLSKAHANTKGAMGLVKDWEKIAKDRVEIANNFEAASRSFEKTANECLAMLRQH